MSYSPSLSSHAFVQQGGERAVMQAVADEPWRSLPDAYGRDHVTLIIRDPRWVFAYWERRGATPFQDETGVILDFYQTEPDGDQRSVFGSQPMPAVGSVHWPLPAGDRYYAARMRCAANPETVIAASNIVYAPPEGPSDVEDASWLTLRELHPWFARIDAGGSSPGVFAIARRAWLKSGYAGSALLQGGTRY